MKFIKITISTCISFFLLFSISNASVLDNRLISYFNNVANSISESVSSIFKDNERVKYLDLNLGVQEHFKPTLSIMNVNKVSETLNGAFFNQNSLSLHDNDQTINIGFGHRSLLNEDKVILGLNVFVDYSFDEQHQRQGAGIEVISSVFDLRGNYYDATSGIQILGDGSTEEGLDGWDTRLDYHLPISYDIRLFGSIFEFENAAGNYELKGEKYGLNAIVDRFNIELGYVDDNKTGDGSFANVFYRIPFGVRVAESKKTNSLFEYVSVRNRLYEPVKRENKIRVVKINAANIVVSGF